MPPDDAKNHEKYLANYRRTGIKKIIDQKRTLTARRKVLSFPQPHPNPHTPTERQGIPMRDPGADV